MEETEVLVGGDVCQLVSISDAEIVCQTSAPSFDTVNPSRRFSGGSGGKTHFFDSLQMESYNFHEVDWLNAEMFQ